MAESSSVSIPSLLVLAGLSFFLYRLFFGGGSRAGPGSSSSRGRRIDPVAVNQVASMFPQLDRRAIAWDLQRNGGNAQATVERMLMTGRLEPPPPSFRPEGINPPPTTTLPTPGSASTKASMHPDLITRYNLSSRLQVDDAATESDAGAETTGAEAEAVAVAAAATAAAKGKAKASGWSTNKTERAAMIQQRKEQMILQARRKMEEKDRREAKGKAPERSQ